MVFKIRCLDHVAIRVKDIEISAQWYGRVLGLNRYNPKEWKDIPVFMLSGKTGVALFPAHLEDHKMDSLSKNVKIDHFAFNVTKEDFILAQEYFTSIGDSFVFQDHHYFHSIYLSDPDGHTVELTCLQVKESEFYL